MWKDVHDQYQSAATDRCPHDMVECRGARMFIAFVKLRASVRAGHGG